MELNENQEKLRKKYFPRVAWTENGPIRRQYMAAPADKRLSVPEALASLAARTGFTAPGQRSVIGDATETGAAFLSRAGGDDSIGLIFGTAPAAFWCDIACGMPDADGWQRTIIRSEEGENLIALAHGEGVLRFRRVE